jgi:DNA-directed RNA polymerase
MCQESLKCTDIASLIVAALSLIVTVLAFIIAYKSLKETKSALKLTRESNLNQIRATVLSLLTERAKEANSLFPERDFISPIIVAQQQLDKVLKNKFHTTDTDREFYIEMFYLTLHTSVRINIWKLDENIETDPIRKEQIPVVKLFLEKARLFDNPPN